MSMPLNSPPSRDVTPSCYKSFDSDHPELIMTPTLPDLAQASASLDLHLSQSLLTRGQWTAEENGRHLACLLAAMVPACGKEESAAACPASVIPPWLAYLTPWIDDSGSADAWPDQVREYASLLRASGGLTEVHWQRLEYRAKAVALAEAMAHTDDEAVLDICRQVMTLLERAIAGEVVSEDEWAKARAAASAAGWATARATAAARAATDVAWVVSGTADAARQAASVREATAAAGAGAYAANRIIAGFFAAWAEEITSAQGAL